MYHTMYLKIEDRKTSQSKSTAAFPKETSLSLYQTGKNLDFPVAAQLKTDNVTNIRHVIRNFTLQRALEIYKWNMESECMSQPAYNLGVSPNIGGGAYDVFQNVKEGCYAALLSNINLHMFFFHSLIKQE